MTKLNLNGSFRRAAALFCIVAGVVLTPCAALACDGSSDAAPASGSVQFIVSALLKRKDSDLVVKLIHAQETARDADEARGILLRAAAKEFPEYTVLDVLTTPLGGLPAGCIRRGRASSLDA